MGIYISGCAWYMPFASGWEIKTPLTIIKADADVLEIEYGENEWVEDIQKQAERLTGLTNNLVYLSRMEETSDSPFHRSPLKSSAFIIGCGGGKCAREL